MSNTKSTASQFLAALGTLTAASYVCNPGLWSNIFNGLMR
jgi:hypothetical protein